MSNNRHNRRKRSSVHNGWDAVAGWYAGWSGKEGSHHHRQAAIPAVLSLLAPAPGDEVLEIGAGHGVLAPHLLRAGYRYTGVDLSPRLLERARRRYGAQATFLLGDAGRLDEITGIHAQSFDAAIFMLSIQDIGPVEAALRATAWALRAGGVVVIVMTHPCFRVPRQSGWGWDPQRKLNYRRIDRYLSPLRMPMQPPTVRDGAHTLNYHRPLSAYVNMLGENGLRIERMLEIPAPQLPGRDVHGTNDGRANAEIPLFLGLRAQKEPGA